MPRGAAASRIGEELSRFKTRAMPNSDCLKFPFDAEKSLCELFGVGCFIQKQSVL